MAVKPAILKTLRLLLLPFAWLFGYGVKWRNNLYDNRALQSWQAEIPVISVGNISSGGTGKTPFAEYLLDYFQKKGRKAAYLSRGYGRASKGYWLVPPRKANLRQYGDEACQVAGKFPTLPVAVAESRQEGINRLIQDQEAELIVLDDAFQHRAVDRDLDIVMIDANHPPYLDHLLPAGLLREPLSSLKRADLIVVNKLEEPQKMNSFLARLAKYTSAPILFCRPVFETVIFVASGQQIEPSSLFKRQVVLFSGIGNNAYFREQVEQQGANVQQHLCYRDHHQYGEPEIKQIQAAYQQAKSRDKSSQLLILTTEKDYYRIKGARLIHDFNGFPLAYVSIGLDWLEGEDALHLELDEIA